MFVARLIQSFSFYGNQNQKIYLTDLDQDTLLIILSYLSSSQIAECRLVCRKFNKICKKLLNRRFSYHCTAIPAILRNLLRQDSVLPSEKEKERNLQMLSACLLLLRAVFGRYISIGCCCFYPGRILDDIQIITKTVTQRKRKWMTLEPPPTQEKTMFNKSLRRLLNLIETAADHFEKKVEPLLPQPRTFVGTKILDLLLSNSEIQQEKTMDSFYKKVAERFPRDEINVMGIRRLLKQTRADLIYYNCNWIYNSSVGRTKNETTCQVHNNRCQVVNENNRNSINLLENTSSEENFVENNKIKDSDVHSQKVMNNSYNLSDVDNDNVQEMYRNLLTSISSRYNVLSCGNFSAAKDNNERKSQLKTNDSDMVFNATKKFEQTPIKLIHMKNAECNSDGKGGYQRKNIFDGNEDTVGEILVLVRPLHSSKNGDHCIDCNTSNDYHQSVSKIKQLLTEVEKSLLDDTSKFITGIKMKEPCCLNTCPSFDLPPCFNGVNSNSTLKDNQHPSTSSAVDQCLVDSLEGNFKECDPTNNCDCEVHNKVDVHSTKSKRLRSKYKDERNVDKKVLQTHKKSKSDWKSEANEDCLSDITPHFQDGLPKFQ